MREPDEMHDTIGHSIAPFTLPRATTYYAYSPHYSWNAHIDRMNEARRTGWQVSDSALYVAASVDALNARGVDIANRVTAGSRDVRG